jgi:hypothetical protein
LLSQRIIQRRPYYAPVLVNYRKRPDPELAG